MLFFTNMSCITSKIEYVISWLKSIPKKKKTLSEYFECDFNVLYYNF